MDTVLRDCIHMRHQTHICCLRVHAFYNNMERDRSPCYRSIYPNRITTCQEAACHYDRAIPLSNTTTTTIRYAYCVTALGYAYHSYGRRVLLTRNLRSSIHHQRTQRTWICERASQGSVNLQVSELIGRNLRYTFKLPTI